MSEAASKSQPTEVDEGYAALEALIDERVRICSQPIFETDADPGALWGHYLGFLEEDRRQHYNCHACRRFIQAYGGLVIINEGGGVESLLWGGDLPKFFLGSAVALRDLTIRAAKDSHAASAGLALFPEILKADLHGIRSVIEAHSRSGEISGAADGNANGIAFQKGSQSELTVRADGTATYVLDRWD